MDVERLKKAAVAAYPELWPESEQDFPDLAAVNRAVLAQRRTEVMTRMAKAIEAYTASDAPITGPDGEEITPLGDFSISLPEDAAMIQQVLTTVTYIDHDGRTAYVVRTMGEGLRTTWLGMCALTQDYLLKLPSGTDDR